MTKITDEMKTAKVKPLDLPNLLRDAFLSGRGLKDGAKLSTADQEAWMAYDPEQMAAYHRIFNALSAVLAQEGEPVASKWLRTDRPLGGSVLLYTLREETRRGGRPMMVNDVTINIERAIGSATDVEPIVRRVMAALSHPAPADAGVVGSQETVTIPKEPTDELLRSMAIRYDHGLGIPGYYDQEIFGAGNVSHERRMESAIRTMRQLHEEVVGTGFYRSALPTKGGE